MGGARRALAVGGPTARLLLHIDTQQRKAGGSEAVANAAVQMARDRFCRCAVSGRPTEIIEVDAFERADRLGHCRRGRRAAGFRTVKLELDPDPPFVRVNGFGPAVQLDCMRSIESVEDENCSHRAKLPPPLYTVKGR
jgi:hypothetical protein